MKKVLLFIGILFFAVGLLACQDELPTYTFEEVLESIEINYAPNNNAEFVTEDLGLPTSSSLESKANLTWLSSNLAVISNSGTVTRQDDDVTVTLILSLRVGSVSEQFLFDVVVKGINIYHTIVFDIDGSLTELVVLDDTMLTQPTHPVKTNYNFIGWFNGDLQYFFNSPVYGDLVLVARFEALSVATYTLEIYVENIDDNNYTKQSEQPITGNIGETINYSQSRNGFILNQELSTLSGTVNTDNPLVIKAYYERLRYEVTYMSTGTILDTMTFKHGQQIATIEAPVVTNFLFIGWYMDQTYDTPFNATSNVTSNMTVYAKYNEITTGQYVTNIYFENIENDEYTLMNTVTQTAQMGTAIDLNIESFSGFVLNTALSVTSATVIQNDIISLDIFYDRIVYSVSFKSDSVEVASSSVKHGGVINEIDDLEKLDHTFLGWTSTLNGTIAYNFSSQVTSNITLYAMWRNDNLPTYTGYYQSLNNLLDHQIRTQLTSIITPMNDRGYTFAITILQNSDRDPSNSSNLFLVYSRESRPSVWSSGATGTWNREHVWPQSKLGTASVSDVHNLRPADPQQNSTRSNYPFVQGTGSANIVTNTSGGVLGFWPGYEDRGDIARILLYMNVRWGLGITGSSVGELELLLRWHLEDPVDDFERNRNNVIYTYQENRNPFIDYPDLVERIWGPIILSNGNSVNLDTTYGSDMYFAEYNINDVDIFSFKENQAYFTA